MKFLTVLLVAFCLATLVFSRNSEDAETLIFRRIGRAFKRGFNKAGRGIRSGFRHTRRGFSTAGRGIRTGFRHTRRGFATAGRGIRTGLRHTGRGFVKAGRGIRDFHRMSRMDQWISFVPVVGGVYDTSRAIYHLRKDPKNWRNWMDLGLGVASLVPSGSAGKAGKAAARAGKLAKAGKFGRSAKKANRLVRTWRRGVNFVNRKRNAFRKTRGFKTFKQAQRYLNKVKYGIQRTKPGRWYGRVKRAYHNTRYFKYGSRFANMRGVKQTLRGVKWIKRYSHARNIAERSFGWKLPRLRNRRTKWYSHDGFVRRDIFRGRRF